MRPMIRAARLAKSPREPKPAQKGFPLVERAGAQTLFCLFFLSFFGSWEFFFFAVALKKRTRGAFARLAPQKDPQKAPPQKKEENVGVEQVDTDERSGAKK